MNDNEIKRKQEECLYQKGLSQFNGMRLDVVQVLYAHSIWTIKALVKVLASGSLTPDNSAHGLTYQIIGECNKWMVDTFDKRELRLLSK